MFVEVSGQGRAGGAGGAGGASGAGGAGGASGVARGSGVRFSFFKSHIAVMLFVLVVLVVLVVPGAWLLVQVFTCALYYGLYDVKPWMSDSRLRLERWRRRCCLKLLFCCC